MEHTECLKEENKTKKSIMQSLSNQYNYTYDDDDNNNNNNNNNINNRNNKNNNMVVSSLRGQYLMTIAGLP